MTFLELVQRAYSEGGLSGVGPQSVDNQSGLNKKLVNWVREAWIDIQAAYSSWKFLRKKETRTLTSGKREYALVADLNLPNVRKWNEDLLFIREPDGSARSQLKLISFDEFEATYASFTSGKPSVFTVTPDYKIAFDATPSKAYVIDLNFWLTGERLAEDTDIPSIPEDYHMTIVWWALVHYGSHEGALQVTKDVKSFYDIAIRRLEADQLDIPHRIYSAPLA
jgi:hypothetical protein